jgi:hypothetical protein
MNLLKRIVKETVLIPYRILQGLGAAMDEVVEPKKRGKEDE